MITITKIFEFEAAHKLENYNGACHCLHGHTYKLEVTVKGLITKPSRMVLDFKDLKNIVKKSVIDTHDHAYLNDIYGDMPTAEFMIEEIVETLKHELYNEYSDDVKLYHVRLWETSTSHADWSEYV